MEEIYNSLHDYLKSGGKSVNGSTIARFFLAHLDEVPDMKLADAAEQCYTSTTSIIRFCRDLGYEDFSDFKDSARDYAEDVENVVLTLRVPVRVFGKEEEYSSSVREWMEQLSDTIGNALLSLDRGQMERLAADILTHRYVYVYGIGMSALIGDQLRIHLARVGINIFQMSEIPMNLPPGARQKEVLGIIITQQGRFLDYGENSSRKVSRLCDCCDKTWAVTMEPKSRKFPVTEVIHIPADDNFETEYHILIAWEELLSECCQQMLEQQEDTR